MTYLTRITDNTNSNSTTTGAFIVDNGFGLGTDFNIGGVITVLNTTDSTNVSTGSIITNGGIGVSKTIYANQLKLSTTLDEIYGGTGISSYTKGDIIYSTNCGNQTINYTKRTGSCSTCGIKINRDLNGSRNIYMKCINILN